MKNHEDCQLFIWINKSVLFSWIAKAMLFSWDSRSCSQILFWGWLTHTIRGWLTHWGWLTQLKHLDYKWRYRSANWPDAWIEIWQSVIVTSQLWNQTFGRQQSFIFMREKYLMATFFCSRKSEYCDTRVSTIPEKVCQPSPKRCVNHPQKDVSTIPKKVCQPSPGGPSPKRCVNHPQKGVSTIPKKVCQPSPGGVSTNPKAVSTNPADFVRHFAKYLRNY